MGRCPSRKSHHSQRTDTISEDTAREGATMRTGSTNETDAKKRRRALSGHRQRAAARPSAKADKDTTKKERGMEWVSDSDGTSNRGTHARHGSDPGKRRTLERAQLLKTRGRSEDHQENSPAAAGRKEKPHTEARRPSGRIKG